MTKQHPNGMKTQFFPIIALIINVIAPTKNNIPDINDFFILHIL